MEVLNLLKMSLSDKGVFEMITLFNSRGNKVTTFKSFEEVMEYFNRKENLKPKAPNSSKNQEKWRFIYLPYRRFSAINDHGKSHDHETEQEAYERQLDLVEVYSGDPQCYEEILVTPDLDLPDLIKNWCFLYAYAHKFVLLQTIYGCLDDE